MKTVQTNTMFLVFSIPWIMVNNVFATESGVLSGTNADSKQVISVSNGTNTDRKQEPSVLNGTNADSKQVPSVLNGTNSELKQLPPLTKRTMAESRPLPSVPKDQPSANKQTARVLGGNSADRIDFAYVAQVFNNKALCGGTIVTARCILTAAHCFTLNADPQFIIIAVGNCKCHRKHTHLPLVSLFILYVAKQKDPAAFF